MARKRIEIDENRVRILAARGLNEAQVAAALGISTDTIGRRKRDSASFAKALADGKALGIAKVAGLLLKSCRLGSTRAQIYYLDRVGKWGNSDSSVSVSINLQAATDYAHKVVGRIIAVIEDEVADAKVRRSLIAKIREVALRDE